MGNAIGTKQQADLDTATKTTYESGTDCSLFSVYSITCGVYATFNCLPTLRNKSEWKEKENTRKSGKGTEVKLLLSHFELTIFNY